MLRPATLVLGLMLWASRAPAAVTDAVEKARAQLEDLSYDKALKIVDQALDADGNNRETLVALYEIEGVCWSNLGKPAKAIDSFRRLLALEPDFRLSKDNPPRVRTPFYEAKEWVDKFGALPPKLAVASGSEGKLTSLTFSLGRDPLKLVKGVRVSVTPKGGAEQQLRPDPKTSPIVIKVDAPSATYQLVLYGAKNAVLATLSGEAKADPVPARVVPEPAPPQPTPAVVTAPQPAPEPPARWRAPTGIVLAVAGAASLGVGAFFGVRASDARRRLDGVQLDPSGAVTDLTQVEAKELDFRATTGAMIADALLIGGGVLAAIGFGILIFELSSGDGSEKVVLAPAAGGAVISGAF